MRSYSIINPGCYEEDDGPTPRVIGQRAASGCPHGPQDGDERGLCPCGWTVNTNAARDWERRQGATIEIEAVEHAMAKTLARRSYDALKGRLDALRKKLLGLL